MVDCECTCLIHFSSQGENEKSFNNQNVKMKCLLPSKRLASTLKELDIFLEIIAIVM